MCFILFCLYIFKSDGSNDEVKREQMERLVREELERWDSESSIGRGPSPATSSASGIRSRSRPTSSAANVSKESFNILCIL